MTRAPGLLAEDEAFQRKTYRVEWQVQRGEIDQYGQNFKAYAVDSFPTREEAAAFLPTVAHEQGHVIGRWIPNDAPHGYCEAQIVYREVPVIRPTAPAADVERVARAICKSRTCEGASCCQWPANRGRTNCPVAKGGYDDAARDAIAAMQAALAGR